MKEIKEYTSIVRYGKKGTEKVLKKGDIISITEKVDGANATFTKDEGNFFGVSSYSRNHLLTSENTLQGFYHWVKENIEPIKSDLNPSFRYIGEWTTKHKIKYKEEYTKTFLLFSIWDEETEKYLSDEVVQSEAKRLGLKTVEYFYYGEYISYEHLMSFVGKSNLTEVPDTGEGIVVKNVEYFDHNGKQVFVKLVTESFAEVQKQRLPKNPNLNEKERMILLSVMTRARVEKIMLKLVDEGIFKREEFILSNMGQIIKTVSSIVKEDMLKEECEILEQIENNLLHKLVGKLLPTIIKEIVKEFEESSGIET